MTPQEFLAKQIEDITIVKVPDPILTTECQPVEDFTPWLEILKMMDVIRVKNNGIGLAAPQVGLPYRAFVIGSARSPLFVINPIIEEYGDRKATMTEGCLSIPGFKMDVVRPTKIKARWLSPSRKECAQMYVGMTARVYQHEMDHLNGVLINRSIVT